MIEMELLDVRVEPPHNVPVVLLREPGTGRILPIYIGASEATAIALAMQHHETPRPMTHDLFRNVLDELGVSLERVVVTELQDKTFYAECIWPAPARTRVWWSCRAVPPTRLRSRCGWRPRSSPRSRSWKRRA
jgi:bifunctional DNase/RNase